MASSPPPSLRYLRRLAPMPHPRVRLVCFPHAGGSASAYGQWHRWAPSDIEVVGIQYAGRQDRITEPPVTEMGELVQRIVEALALLRDRPLALFGHSMGASVAHEVARALEAEGFAPRMLLASSQPPPHLLDTRDTTPDEDEALVREVQRLGGTETEVFDDPLLRQLIMPALRADFRLLRTYRPDPDVRLSVPLVSYAADRDPYVMPETVRAWNRATTGPTDFRIWAGDHFYLVPHQSAVVTDIVKRL